MFIKNYIARRKAEQQRIQLENAEIARVDFAVAMIPYTSEMVNQLVRLEWRIKELESA